MVALYFLKSDPTMVMMMTVTDVFIGREQSLLYIVSDLTFEYFYILLLFADVYIKYVMRVHEVMYSYA